MPNLATSRNSVSGISIARQGDRVVGVGGSWEVGAVLAFDEEDSGEGMADGEGGFGLKIKLIMALMTVILI
jgi:hypothetical protein